MVGALGAVVAGVTPAFTHYFLAVSALLFATNCVVAFAVGFGTARWGRRVGYRLGLERARQCAIYPPQSAFHYEARAAHDDVFRRISTLIEEDNP